MKSKKFEKLDVIIDNPNSWMWKYIEKLEKVLDKYSTELRFFKSADEIKKGDIMFILSCDRILKQNDLDKHKSNIVIHASDLPKGKGWSPWSWEVENGAEFLTLTLFEAELSLDSGPWYIKDRIKLSGLELIDEIRELLAIKEFEMIDRFLHEFPKEPIIQSGEESVYQKRNSKNQEIDPSKTINDQFNILRVCDNDNYPAYFYKNGKKYILKIIEEVE